ncbi:MAG TPA: efflux transporter outer membrane subunit [Candidatus Omnitrophota bacterium]|nr:efflux transporter outer membrane subunit [Candidatus Omnitrophota bacterium]HPD84721.1 efflux transporter outer membrane subunit [Candidatus Omnitrophota bacterium]HRZ03579.1 efflux transporter outer membrane subunit [Candidatus Omnitrophota bacterium]
MNRKQIILIAGTILFLSGCTMIPKYTRPQSPVPATLPTGEAYKDDRSAHEGVLSAEGLKWQNVFPDEKLQKVIEISLLCNRDLRLAALNVEQARALYGVQRAELFPSVSATGARSKQRAYVATTGKTMVVEQYSVDLGITAWEVDFFGRIRSLKEQALQEYLSTEQAQRNAQNALISEVGRVYLTLAADRENLKLAQSTLEAQQGVHDVIRLRYDHGVATEIDLRRSKSQVDKAKGDIARYTQWVAQDENALNLLAGSPVPEELLPSDLTGVTPPKDISPGLSSDVLLRRPDILAAEHDLKAAYAFIGAARAAFFPQISLTTAIGTASSELSGLFKAGSSTWNFSPQTSMPIFDARTWAAYRVSKAAREIALTQYEKTIQVAFKEVADVLAVLGTVDDQLAAQEAVVDSAKKVYELSQQRYNQGIDGYLSVWDAQRSLYAAQQSLTYLHLSRLVHQVRLFAVLGGDGEL